jgi:hypothetical protein
MLNWSYQNFKIGLEKTYLNRIFENLPDSNNFKIMGYKPNTFTEYSLPNYIQIAKYCNNCTITSKRYLNTIRKIITHTYDYQINEFDDETMHELKMGQYVINDELKVNIECKFCKESFVDVNRLIKHTAITCKHTEINNIRKLFWSNKLEILDEHLQSLKKCHNVQFAINITKIIEEIIHNNPSNINSAWKMMLGADKFNNQTKTIQKSNRNINRLKNPEF